VSKKRMAPENASDIKRLTDCLDKASSTNPAHEAERAGSEARSRLVDLLRQIDRDLATISSRNRSEDERLGATKRLLTCYRLIHSGANKPQEERDRSLAVLAEIEVAAGINNLRVRLQSLMHALARDVFLSADPVHTLELILYGKVRRGAPKKEDRRKIEIAAAVEQRRRRGMTFEDACLEVSKEQVSRRNPIGPDGVRRVYENLKKEKGGLWSIVLVEASCIEERANAKATS